MRKISMLLFAMSFLLILSSCNTEAENEQSLLSDVPSEVNVVLDDNLKIDAEVTVPTDLHGSLYKYRAAYFTADSDSVYERLFSGKAVTSSDSYNNGEDGTNETSYSYYADDGSFLHCGGSYITFDTSFSYKILDAFHPYYVYGSFGADGFYNADKFTNTEEFDFSSADAAAQEIEDLLTGLGIDLYSEKEVYYLDYETLSEQYSNIKDKLYSDSDYSWSEEDNCYYFNYYQSIDGIPLAHIMHGDIDGYNYITDNQIEAIYSNEGIQYVNCGFLYSKNDSTKEEIELTSFDSVIEAVENKYNNVILDSETTIKNIYFCYVATPYSKSDNDFMLTPAWLFEVFYEDEDRGDGARDYIIIDAESGEEIL